MVMDKKYLFKIERF